MSQENVDLYRGAIDAFNRRDVDAFLALMDEKVEATSFATVVEGSVVGHEGIRQWWEGIVDAFPDWALEILEIRDLGDATLAALRGHGHGATSDMPVELFVWQTVRSRDGKCVQWYAARTEAEALEAVGLQE